MLSGKKIILGVCGSIAAYKAAFLIRLLIKEGAEVQVIASSSAFSFISPLTLSTLSKKPVLSDFVKNEQGQWNNHVDLGLWADLMLIAPASANTIAKCANGLCDNLLTAVYLSARCPVIFAPAMDLDMYQHPAVIENLRKLDKYGNKIMQAETGELASGLIGQGRMPEPESILSYITSVLIPKTGLFKKRVLVTAGPTYEAIDPVRFVGNRSTGKMGYAIAEKCRDMGAIVTLISGPTSLNDPTGMEVIRVESADEMYAAAVKIFPNANIAVLSAAVADYKPSVYQEEKIKKSGNAFELILHKNPDIASELGKMKKDRQLLVGFALETQNELDNAREKLVKKNLDLIVLNSLKDSGAGFTHDTNKISILGKDNKVLHFELKSKKDVASDIVETIINNLND